MSLIPSRPTSAAHSAAEAALARFVTGHAEALIAAAALLGGEPAVRRTARLLESLLDGPPLTRRVRRDLVDLHRLLSLDRVDDLESPEAGCFAAIDPASPVVEDICALTDAFRCHLVALAESAIGDPVWQGLTAA